MKKTTDRKKNNNGNTLFNYFKKTNEPKKPESLSSVIARQSAAVQRIESAKSCIITSSFTATKSNTLQHQTIDLTTSTDSDKQWVDLTTDDSPTSSQGSFHSTEYSEGMKNTSKYNRKAWAPIDNRRGPLRSSQESTSTPSVVMPLDKIIPVRRQTAPVRYDWVGPNDVKPYSSNYAPYSSTNTTDLKRPNISLYTAPKDDGENNPPYFNKRRVLPNKISENNWSRTKGSRVTSKSPVPSPSMSSVEYRPTLSSEQQRVLEMVLHDKKSLFFTGSAGTGKSVLLRAIIDEMSIRYGAGLAVTASTGIAACNINGCTLHR